MPVFKNPSSEEPGSRPDASQVPSGPEQPRPQVQTSKEARQKLRQQVKQAHRKLAKQELEIAALRAMLARRDAGEREDGIRPENIVWVFGSGRTGSSWLTFIMGSLSDHTRWNEPLVGNLFGHLYYERGKNREDEHFILGSDRETWLSSIRTFVLGSASAKFPTRVEKGYLVIKEPHGSVGAPLLMEALPESRMIFLVRDPRDVVASALDANRKGSRPSERRVKLGVTLLDTMAEQQPDVWIAERAGRYLRDIDHTKRAYEAHEGRKVLVRYEDLRTDTLAQMKRIYSTLEIPVDQEELAKAVEKRSWENVPEEEKGEGKIRRKATPGGWREDLTPEQVQIVERITAPLLEEFYSGA